MIQVAVGILFNDGAVLLCQRKATARYGLKWEFPGGKLELGETPEDCLVRELYEELSIRATVGPLLHRSHFLYPDNGSFDVFYYHITSYTGVIVNRVFESLTWAPPRNLPSFDILEGNRDVVELLITTHANS